MWKDIPGYEGFYQVSDEGQIRSLIRVTPDAILKGVRKEKKILKPGYNLQGRQQVTLCRDGITKRFLVHTLVLEAFTGPKPQGAECRHVNTNYIDNRLTNLEWKS